MIMLKQWIRGKIPYPKRMRLHRLRMRCRMALFAVLDVLCVPLTVAGALWFRYLRTYFVSNFPFSKKILLKIGVFPIIDHYYEPLFHPRGLRYPLRQRRQLPGISFNDAEQLSLLRRFDYNDELLRIPLRKTSDALEYSYDLQQFLPGDAEYFYNMIRWFKPRRIVEIGSGQSTLMARTAIAANQREVSGYRCEHICIEPYEQRWLEQTGVQVLRKKVEAVGTDFFRSLRQNDMLFIDSSHIIRPQGDVLYEYLEILPGLHSGVLIHIHDIFTPADYPEEWFSNNFWNEQYLLEAFLAFNTDFRIVAATHYLFMTYPREFNAKCPVFARDKNSQAPRSFWMVRN